MVKKTLVVGDVHGCLTELENLLKEVGVNEGLRLIFVGDLVNRGPDSLGVLRLVHRLGAELVLGNHEFGFLEYMREGREDLLRYETLKTVLGAQLPFWLAWFRRLPVYIEDEDLIVVHAGLVPDRSLAQTEPWILTRIRTWDGEGTFFNRSEDPSWFDLYRGEKLVVFGHWARRGLVWRPNAVGLDTGCVYGRYLSALMLPERRVIQVPAQRVYVAPD